MTYKREATELAERLGLRIASRVKVYGGKIKVYRSNEAQDYHALGQTIGGSVLYIAGDWMNVVAWLQGWSAAKEDSTV